MSHQGELYPDLVPPLDLDAFYTPERLARACVEFLFGELGWTGTALDAHAGSGVWLEQWSRLAPMNRAIGWDRNPFAPALRRSYSKPERVEVCSRGVHFLRDPLPIPFDGKTPIVPYVIGNPPFSDGENEVGVPHVEQALRVAARGVAYLLPVYFLGNGERFDRLHSRRRPSHVRMITPRPSFGGGGGSFEVVLVVYERGRLAGRRTSFGWLHDNTGRRWRSN